MTKKSENTSTCGKYRGTLDNRVAVTTIGDLMVSTIGTGRDGAGGDWFETLTFVPGQVEGQRPTRHVNEAAALVGHAEAVVLAASRKAAEVR
jgi:hypothetical protein